MGILGAKEDKDDSKNNPSNVPVGPNEERRRHVELLGRQFHIVRDGLDPEEVITFLETIAGSSEAAFKRLEQFTAFQSVAKTMEESILEARELAERAKEQARIEAQSERTMVIEEARQQMSSILEQTQNSCLTSVDAVHGALLEAVTRTEEVQREALNRAKSMIASSLAEIHQNIQGVMHGNYSQAGPAIEAHEQVPDLSIEPAEAIEDHEQVPDLSIEPAEAIEAQEEVPDLSIEPAETADKTDESETEDVEPEEEPAFDLATLQKSLLSLEASMSNLNESKNAFGQNPETPIAVLDEEDEQEADKGDKEENEGEDDVEEGRDSPSDSDTAHAYSGEVTVEISGGAEETWMDELRQRMHDIPGARIRAESGMDERTSMVRLSLNEPVRLLPILLALPRVNRVMPGRLNGGSSDKKGLKLWSKANKGSKQNTITIELNGNGSAEPPVGGAEDDTISAS
jgi:hypothetical protein